MATNHPFARAIGNTVRKGAPANEGGHDASAGAFVIAISAAAPERHGLSRQPFPSQQLLDSD
jgi:hypothetical protein